MHHEMKLGPVWLRVRDINAMLEFYAKEMGLRLIRRHQDIVELGSTEKSPEPLLVLRQDPKAGPASHDAAGLYHYAILLPDRKSLAAAYLTLGNSGVVFDGFADHLVSEALYLADPEGNGIEIYADRPRDQWKHDQEGSLQMATLPLDIDSLLGELSGVPQNNLQAIPEGARIGHIHLKVTELKRSINFYQSLVGFDLMSYWGSTAFLSVAGYHHHIGMNTWESLMGPGSMDDRAGLEHFTFSIPDRDFVNKLASKLSEASAVVNDSSDEILGSDPDGIKFAVKASL